MNSMEKFEKRMVELNNDLQNKKTDPDFGFENIESVDMLVKIIVNLTKNQDNHDDGIYIYMDEEGEIVDAEYFFIVDDEETVLDFDDDQFEIIKELYSDVFAVDVE